MISAACLCLYSMVTLRDPLLQMLGVSLGGLLFTALTAAVYVTAGFHLADGGLKILDWMLIAMSTVMMGLFQWIGAEPLYWFVLFFLPCLLARAVSIYFIKRGRKRKIL